MNFLLDLDFSVTTMHPDRNLVFFIEHLNKKLMSYDMDTREVRDICTLPHGIQNITPYVPYFSE